jgi:four helix bundle protein
VNSFKITRTFPNSEKWGMGSQINRSAISISSNIAEGGSRSSRKEYNHFIEIALGSSFELETQLLLARDIQLGNQDLINQTLVLLAEEEKMLTAFSKALLTANS